MPKPHTPQSPGLKADDLPPRALSADSPLRQLIATGVVLDEEWYELPAPMRAELAGREHMEATLSGLMDRHLLTRFQADTIRRGRLHELILGHYRILEPLGRGGMGTVYRAEHRHLRRPVAVKVLAERFHSNPRLLARFLLEARAVARLQHPNIISCLDAGREDAKPPWNSPREYFVMDLVSGADLQCTVAGRRPLQVPRAAALFRQVADALSEAHRFGLIHRDVKPSNIFVTPDWQAKLLDFGLARHPCREITEPGAVLGTIGYMAPEQAADSNGVDARADVYGLGASLFLALTGEEPFPDTNSSIAELYRRQNAAPPRMRRHRPELPVELDDLVSKLMDPKPEHRFPSAAAVSAALLPFVHWRPSSPLVFGPESPGVPRILVVDDDADVRAFVRSLLDEDYECSEAGDGRVGLTMLESQRFDLVLVDQEMPRIDGARLISTMLQVAAPPQPMVLYMSGRVPTESLGGLLMAGADDFIRKPFTASELLSRVRGLLKRRGAASCNGDSVTPVIPLTPTVEDPIGAFGSAAAALLEEIGTHSLGYHARLPQYVRVMAAAAKTLNGFDRLSDPTFVELLAKASLAHDIGLAALPGNLVGKPGRVGPDERIALQTHTSVGSRILATAAADHPHAFGFVLASEIARHHHERWDGGGYPDGLSGQDVPLSARMVSVVTVYDALRSRRPYRPALGHPRTVQLMISESAGQFDPDLLVAFASVADEMDRIFLTTCR